MKDRRQGKRYLTLKNFRNAAIAGLLVFAVITIRSEMRGRTDTDYGRLYEGTLPAVDQKPVEVVHEANAIPDATHADPTLLEPMVREQWLHEQVAATTTTAPIAVDESQRAVAAVALGETDVAIVGGSDGVAIIKQQRSKPQLAGGFGRND